jgi:hypothetical protein
LKDDWDIYYDTEMNSYYYFNDKTGESTWIPQVIPNISKPEILGGKKRRKTNKKKMKTNKKKMKTSKRKRTKRR